MHIPSDLVAQALDYAPRSCDLAGRAEGTSLCLDGTDSYLGTDGCGVETLDFESGVPHTSTKQDVARMARVIEPSTLWAE